MIKERLKNDYKITKDKSSTSRSLRFPKMSNKPAHQLFTIFMMMIIAEFPLFIMNPPLKTNVFPKFSLT